MNLSTVADALNEINAGIKASISVSALKLCDFAGKKMTAFWQAVSKYSLVT